MSGQAVITGAAVSAAVVLAGSFTTTALFGERPASFTASVTSVSEDGRSICLDRAESPCGLVIGRPGQVEQVVAGSRVRVTEIWLDGPGGAELAFHVRPD